MNRTRTIISAAFVATLMLLVLAACGGGTASPAATGTPNVVQGQPTNTALPLITATPASITAGATVTSNPPTAQPAATDTPVAVEPTAIPNYPAAAAAAVTAAKAKLAKAVGVRPEAITVISVKEEQWPDSSIGCPQPGTGYMQVITPGYRITLAADGKQYEYNTNADGSNVVTCASQTGGQANYPAAAEAAVAAAKKQMAKDINVPLDAITVVKVEEARWSDNNLECPPTMGMAKLDVLGYRIIMQAKGEQYEYRTNDTGSIARSCPSGANSGGGPGTGVTDPPQPAPINPGNTSGTGKIGGEMTQAQTTEAAKADLAKRLGIDTASITVKSAQEQMWNNSGLGCGKGMYLQVITPGYLIVLTANGSDYAYHTNKTGTLVLCVNDEPAQP